MMGSSNSLQCAKILPWNKYRSNDSQWSLARNTLRVWCWLFVVSSPLNIICPRVQLRVQKYRLFISVSSCLVGSADVEEQSSLNTYICLSVVLGRRWRVCTVLVSFSIYELIYATTQESRVHRRRTLALRKLLHLWIRRIKGSSLPHQSFSDYSLSPRWDTREIMLREKWLVKVSSIV